MSKHTPGPWKYDDTYGLIVAQDGAEIAACHSGIAANALLIAVASDLLRALQVISGWSKCQCRTTEHGSNPNCPVLIADQAIAKAEGTS